MSCGSGWSDRLNWRSYGLYFLCLVTCAIWVALSQVPIFSWRGHQTFVGLDGALGLLEEKTIEARLNARGELPSPVRLIYVNVDSKSLAAIGNFPWNRSVFAEALDALFLRGKIRAAGMDFVFGNAGLPQLGRAEAEAGSAVLGKSIREHGRVVLAASYGTQLGRLGKKNRSFPFLFEHHTDISETDLPELPDFPVVGPTWGHIGLIDTAGYDLRWIPAFAQTEYTTYYAMAVQLALLHAGLDESALEIRPDQLLIRDPASKVVYDIPLSLGQLIEPNWFSAWNSDENPHVEIAWVLEFDRLAREGTDEEKQHAQTFFENFRDAIVLIGPTDPLLGDNSRALMSGTRPVPRVSVHGNLLKTILSGAFPHRLPAWANALIICALGLGTAGLCIMKNRYSRAGKALACALVLGYIAAAFLVFLHGGILVPLVAPVGAALSCTFLAIAHQLGVEEKQRQRIKSLFGSYVSAAVVNEMIEKSTPPKTGGSEVEITAFFSDVIAFSTLAESLSATELVELMCEYFGECTSAVTGEQGTLDKYVGDAIIAMFGAPLACTDHAAAACRAALALQAAQARLRSRWSGEARWPETARNMRSRVGLHTGPAVVGNIGSELRFNYTMMGDTVNLAQRVEASASHYGSSILVSGETRAAALARDPALVFLPIDRALVPGRNHPVDLFELLGSGEADRRLHEARIERYLAALEIYRRGAWGEAAAAFESAQAGFPPGKSPASVMRARCWEMRDRPPVENLVFALTKEAPATPAAKSSEFSFIAYPVD